MGRGTFPGPAPWLPDSLVQGESKMVKGKEFGLFCPGLWSRALAAGDVYYCSEEDACANTLCKPKRAEIILVSSEQAMQVLGFRKGSVKIGTYLGLAFFSWLLQKQYPQM